jgi:hypothetical protein
VYFAICPSDLANYVNAFGWVCVFILITVSIVTCIHTVITFVHNALRGAFLSLHANKWAQFGLYVIDLLICSLLNSAFATHASFMVFMSKL